MVMKRVKKFCGNTTGQGPAPPAFELIQYEYINQPPTEAARDQIEAARAYWNSVLPDPLPPVNLAGPGGGPNYTQIRITVEFTDLDDTNGNVLAQAGAFNDFRRGSRVVQGAMEIDEEDIPGLIPGNGLFAVVKHELFHVFTTFRDNAVSGPLANNDMHVGDKALAEYSVLTGANEVFIPTEPGDLHHWRESVFRSELQTPFYSFGAANPNSRMSIAVLEDLGYPGVNYGPAEPYVLGQPPFRADPGFVPLRWKCGAENGKCVIREVKDPIDDNIEKASYFQSDNWINRLLKRKPK